MAGHIHTYDKFSTSIFENIMPKLEKRQNAEFRVSEKTYELYKDAIVGRLGGVPANTNWTNLTYRGVPVRADKERKDNEVALIHDDE